jgi:acetolactate synthase-1/2/3 large subunit
MVCVTGQVSSKLIGYDAFQETDVTGITLPITKHNYLVTDVRDINRVMREAFYIARTGRPGPVLIDISRTRSRRPSNGTMTPAPSNCRAIAPICAPCPKTWSAPSK